MKNILSTVFLAVFFTMTISAQDTRPLRVAFGVMPASSWIKPEGDVLTKEKSSLGFSYGILLDLMIADNPNYAFGTGILINSQGGTIKNVRAHDGRTIEGATNDSLFRGFATVDESYSLQYLDVPLTLKLKTNEIGYLTYFGQFGLDMSFNIKSRRDTDGAYADGVNISIKDENVSEETNLIRMALQVGAGAEFNLSGDTYLMAGLVWNNGLTNVFQKRKEIATDDNDETIPAINGNETAKETLGAGEKFKAINNYLGLQIGIFF